jgi:hypothetical protein
MSRPLKWLRTVILMAFQLDKRKHGKYIGKPSQNRSSSHRNIYESCQTRIDDMYLNKIPLIRVLDEAVNYSDCLC